MKQKDMRDETLYDKDIEEIIYEERIFFFQKIINSKFFEYSHFNKIKKWPSKINMCCMWDSYPFPNEPVPIQKNKICFICLQ